MQHEEFFNRLSQIKVVPVVAIENAADAAPLGEALLAGNLPCAEITFRTDAAADAIAAVSRIDGMLVGAGTVLSVDQAKAALDAGATFIVSPGFNPKVVDFCRQANVPITPGVATPTEIEMAINAGLEVVKFFPAEALGGLKMLKAVAAPYNKMRFVPTGGIGPGNLNDYLAMKAVIACGGSWMVKKDLISAGKFDEIRKLASEATDLANR